MMIPGVQPPPNGDAPAAPPAGPAASPMSGPTEQEGRKAQAAQGLQLALKLIESALLIFGSASPEGKKLRAAMSNLEKLAGPSGGPDMNSNEVKMLAAKAGPENAQPPGAGPGGPPAGGMPMLGPGPRPM